MKRHTGHTQVSVISVACANWTIDCGHCMKVCICTWVLFTGQQLQKRSGIMDKPIKTWNGNLATHGISGKWTHNNLQVHKGFCDLWLSSDIWTPKHKPSTSICFWYEPLICLLRSRCVIYEAAVLSQGSTRKGQAACPGHCRLLQLQVTLTTGERQRRLIIHSTPNSFHYLKLALPLYHI